MNFFHIESLPHSLPTMHLLVFLLFIAKTLFIAYLGALIGGTILSHYYRTQYNKSFSSDYLNFSVDFLGKLNNNILTPFGLGIAPLFAIVFIYIQFSINPNNSIISALILTTILFPISLIINKFDFKKLSKTSNNHELSNKPLSTFTNLTALVLFVLVAFFFTGADVSFVNGMGNIGKVSIFTATFSFIGIFSFLSIIFLGIAFSIINFLQFDFNKYTFVNTNESIKKIFENNIDLFIFSGISFLVMIFIKNVLLNYILFTPLFAVLFILTVVLMVIAVFLLKNQLTIVNIKPVTSVYLIILVFLLSFGGSDSFLFLKASENNIAMSAEKYESELAEHKTHSSKNEVKINAEELFFDKCVTCHSYDKKGIGPALNKVVVKYKGKKEELKNFLLSPVKVDPNYVAMPNQGLKPAEAKAIAEYLMKELNIK